MRAIPFILFSLGLLIAEPELSAQEPQVRAGERIRIRAGRAFEGLLEGATQDSIRLGADGTGTPVSLAWSSVERLEVYGGRKSRSRGALVGAGVGVGVGLILGVLVGSGDCGDDYLGLCETAETGAMVLLPMTGLILGGGIGALAGGGDRWISVSPVPRVVTPAGTAGAGFLLGLRLEAPF